MTPPDKRIRPDGHRADSRTTGDAITASLPLDDIHRAFMAGWDAGYAAGQQDSSVDLAREWLHEDARRWTEQAVSLARARHGDGWAAEVGAQAQGVAA